VSPVDLSKACELPEEAEIIRLSHLEGSYFLASYLREGVRQNQVIRSDGKAPGNAFAYFALIERFPYAVSENGKPGNLWCFSAPGAIRVSSTQPEWTVPESPFSIHRFEVDESLRVPLEREGNQYHYGKLPSETQTVQIQISFPSYLNRWSETQSNRFRFRSDSHPAFNQTNTDGKLLIRGANSGSYRFEVSAIDPLNRETETLQIHFRVLPPRYFSIWALLTYLCGAIILISLYVRWRLRKQRDKLWEERMQMERRMSLESSAKEAQIQALRLQLNPHFLFNSLSFIAQSLEDRPQVKQSVQRLAAFLNHALDDENTALIPLERELSSVEAYLAIESEKRRFDFEVRYNIDPETRNYSLPGLILQPLVENAIKYGNEDAEGRRWIDVGSGIESESLVVSVTNSGEWKAPRSGRLPIGLKNVEKRLKLEFGEACFLDFSDDPEIGTVSVRLHIPLELVSRVEP